jgi:hypothetical protein
MNCTPDVSILIPWCGRDELQTTLLCNDWWFTRHSVEILVINVGGDSQQLSSLIAASGARHIRQLDVEHKPFNKGLALNIGLHFSRARTVLVLDADVVLITDVLTAIGTELDRKNYLTIEWVFESDPQPPVSCAQSGVALMGQFLSQMVFTSGLELFFANGSTVRYRMGRKNWKDGGRAAPGLLLTQKDHLLAVGAYNSDLHQWGWEDDDIQIRLQHECGVSRLESGVALHLTHGDDRRVLNGTSRARSDRLNFLTCCLKYNQKDFQGTYHRDVAELASRTSELPGRGRGPAATEVAITRSDARVPLFSEGRQHCGTDEGTLAGAPHELDWSAKLPSVDQLAIESILHNVNLGDKRLLHVGIGNSSLAARFAASLRYVDGVTVSDAELRRCNDLRLPNYTVILCNKYSTTFVAQLPHTEYDIIVDNNIASFACCQFHLKTLFASCARLLAPAGRVFTAEQGMQWTATDACFRMDADSLVVLAEEHGMAVSRMCGCVYVLTHRRQ